MINSSELTGKLALDANGLNNLKQAAKDNSPAAIKAAASQFEAIFVNMMLKSMRDATPQDSPFDSEQSRSFTSMLDQQLSQNLAAHGVGLADVLTKQLSRAAQNADASQNQSARQGAAPLFNNPQLEGAVSDQPNPAMSTETTEYPVNAAPPGLKAASGLADGFQSLMAAHAEKASRATGIPAHFMLGQAALESGWGKRQITGLDGTPSNNLFGIKATQNWNGKVVEAVTTEYVDGIKQKRIEKFRAYDSYADSFKDFGNLMRSNTRYSKAMANLQDANQYAQALQNAGYATDPDYASKLASVIQKVAAG